MKILYLANFRLPSERAFGIQITKTCESLAQAGVELELVYPYRRSPNITRGIFAYFDIKQNFKIRRLLTPDFYLPGRGDKIAFYIKSFISALALSIYTWTRKSDVIYTRDELTAWLVALVGKKVVYEAHNFSSRRRWIYNKLRKSGVRLIVITKTLKEEFINSGWMEERVLVAADGVDIDKFNLSITQERAREKLGIPLNKKIILYSGHLFGWKGVDIMAKAASGFPNACFIFVGGSGKEVDGFRNKYSNTDNIKIINQQPHQSIPYFLKAADVLVLPNSKQQSISRLYTSPLKMFEYMSSKRPIVASNLPSLREILNEGNSILVESDNSEALKVGIERLLSDKQLADRLSSQAFEDVQEFTWQKRAKKILEFI